MDGKRFFHPTYLLIFVGGSWPLVVIFLVMYNFAMFG